ncbi:MAG: DUF4295 domain-containing protein [Bacteroidia bacterium]|nr:DUF4295 domain-containing protein [Bacteroidia bacterium]MDW8348320.1 DUF4295 family protein [Bacteroidia bacterium]
MAKKVVATFKSGEKQNWAKVVKAVKNKDGNYSFQEVMVPLDKVQETLKENKSAK